jgi:hypothetical protein
MVQNTDVQAKVFLSPVAVHSTSHVDMTLFEQWGNSRISGYLDILKKEHDFLNRIWASNVLINPIS